MRRETIKYTDFDGTVREETFYFNLTRTECIALHMDTPGGLGEILDRIVKANDANVIRATFEDLLGRSYGVKSDDGRRLRKGENGELFRAFKETLAYDELMCKLIAVPGYSADFFNEVIPTDQIRDLVKTIETNSAEIRSSAQETIKQVK